MNQYEHILSPLKINEKFTFKNRIMCAPMAFCTAVVGNEFDNARFAQGKYYKVEDPAKGGAAIVSVGELDVNNREAKRMPLPDVDLSLSSGNDFNAISEYAWRIKRHGAIALVELCHPGAVKPKIPGTPNAWGPVETDNSNVDQSQLRAEMKNLSTVEAMDKEKMDSVCNDFATAALYAKKAGFDGVCIHAAHGFLIHQFLSSHFNLRNDEYGGSLENRARFPLMILSAIREVVGTDFLIECRVSGSEKIPEGMSAEETGQFLHMAEGLIDCVHVSSGLYQMQNDSNVSQGMFTPHGYNVEYSRIIKKYTSIPVGVIGAINSPEMAEQIIMDGDADYVVMGRQLISDPEFVNKVASGREKEIRKCVRCYTCMSPIRDPEQEPYNDGLVPWLRVGKCALNPLAGESFTMDDLPKPGGKRNVIVIGGGVAGMQAAITAAQRGHLVTLYEKAERLGGTLNFTEVDVDKEDLCDFKNVLEHELDVYKVSVKLNTEVTPEMISNSTADAIIIAVGATPVTPGIKGIENAVQALRVYDPDTKLGKRIVMIGGGLVGCETGVHLTKLGHEVTIVEMLQRVAHESCGRYRISLVLEMERDNIKAYCNTKCTEICNDGVWIDNEKGEQSFLPADSVVYALGMRPNSTKELEEAAGERFVRVIGDCEHAAKVAEAVKSGFQAAIEIL